MQWVDYLKRQQELLRPYGKLIISADFGNVHRAQTQIGAIEFYHPDDVEKNRREKAVLEWPLHMPVTGILSAVNPSATRRSVLEIDANYDDWIFHASGIHQWDWNGLLTKEEYLDFATRSSNLLRMDWRKSPNAKPSAQANSFWPSSNPRTAESHIEDIAHNVQQQVKQKQKRL